MEDKLIPETIQTISALEEVRTPAAIELGIQGGTRTTALCRKAASKGGEDHIGALGDILQRYVNLVVMIMYRDILAVDVVVARVRVCQTRRHGVFGGVDFVARQG